MQSLVALSVGESEYYAGTKASAAGLSCISLLAEWNISIALTLNTDSTTAKSLCDRTGVGNLTKHMQTRWLWLQELVKNREITVCKVGTEFNPSDMCTKPVSSMVLDRHCD